MRLKSIVIVLLTLSLMFTSGCWDMIEIENRAMVAVVMVDLIENSNEAAEKENSPFCEDKPNRIRVTFGLNNPSKLMEGGEGAAVLVTVDAANLPDAMEELGGRISRKPFYGQTRLLIFSDKVLKDRKIFMELIDEFERKPIINQHMKIVAFKGDPMEIEKVDTKLENVHSIYIFKIMENSEILSNTVSLSLYQLIVQLRNDDGNAAIPLLGIEEDKQSAFTIDKLVLVNNYKLLTILDSKYIKTYKLINGKLKNGRKLFPYEGVVVPFYIFTADSRRWLVDETSGLKFKVKLVLEGDIEQFEFQKLLFDPKKIEDAEKSIEKYTVEELDAATRYFQKDIGYDYLGFKEYMYKYHYKSFKKYEKNWDEAFANAQIEYDVEAYIRRIGTSKE